MGLQKKNTVALALRTTATAAKSSTASSPGEGHYRSHRSSPTADWCEKKEEVKREEVLAERFKRMLVIMQSLVHCNCRN